MTIGLLRLVEKTVFTCASKPCAFVFACLPNTGDWFRCFGHEYFVGDCGSVGLSAKISIACGGNDISEERMRRED